MFGKIPFTETCVKISESLMGRSISKATKTKISESHTGKTLSMETKEKINKIHTSKEVTEATRAKIRSSLIGQKFSEKRKLNMSIGSGTLIYVYTFDESQEPVNTFSSTRKITKFFNVNKNTIVHYIKSGKLFCLPASLRGGKGKWILTSVRYSASFENVSK